VVDLLKQSEAPDTGAILEPIKDIFNDICDDWRELVDVTRRDAAELARAAALARRGGNQSTIPVNTQAP
jgi:hypothetical protein